ncbi:MAG: tetratricopeptide repeat protein [Pseudomarimonas sp.]
MLCLVYLLTATAPSRAADEAGLLALMSGEFALQEGRFADAALAYADAAKGSADPELAERAARVALLSNDPVLIRQALIRWQKLAPDSAGARQMQAVLALREERVDDALVEIRALFASGEKDSWRFALQALAGERKSTAVGKVMARLVADDAIPTAIEPMLGFGGLAQSLELNEVAAAMALAVTKHHPELAKPWLWRAEIERQQEQPKAALASVRRALALPELDTATRLSAAALLDALGETLAAADVLAKGEQTDATLAGRAAYLARANATEALTTLYTELQVGASPLPAARLYLLGQLAELRKQPADALTWYRQIKDPAMRDQTTLRIALVQEESGDLPAAMATLHAYQNSDSENGEALVNSYLLEAELLNRRKKHEDALAVYERALAVFEDDPELLYARALGFEKVGRVDAAIADLRRLHELDPENADTMNALGYTLADRTEHFAEALTYIERALKLKPDNPAIIDSMGWVLFRLGRLEESLVHLRRAFELQRDAEVAAHLGEVLWVAGNKDEAQSIFRLGKEIDPDNAALNRTMKRLLP